MGLFKGIEDASATEGRQYFNPGAYDIQVISCKHGESRKKIEYFAVKMKILGTNNPLHPVGSTADYITMSDKDGYLGNVKAFLRAILSNDPAMAGQMINESEITDEVATEMMGEDAKMIVGQTLRVQVSHKPTLGGGVYSMHTWLPLVVAA